MTKDTKGQQWKPRKYLEMLAIYETVLFWTMKQHSSQIYQTSYSLWDTQTHLAKQQAGPETHSWNKFNLHKILWIMWAFFFFSLIVCSLISGSLAVCLTVCLSLYLPVCVIIELGNVCLSLSFCHPSVAALHLAVRLPSPRSVCGEVCSSGFMLCVE